METLDISFGKNRSETNWKPEYLTWEEFVELLRKPRRTAETMAAYDRMSTAERGKAKDGRAFVGGLVRGGRRLKASVDSRSLITLDSDSADEDFLFTADLILGGSAYAVYSTHSYREDNRKYRLVAPASRSMSPDEYAAVSRKLAEQIGMTYWDKTTFEVHRLMYLPSCSKDAEPVLEVAEGAAVDVDAVLGQYEDWRDITSWPGYGDGPQRKAASKMEDPRAKTGVIGAFCRAYSITEAIEALLPDAYEQTAVEDRWTFTGSESFGGMIVYDGDTFAYSHHESDPISGREVNAFDLVRLHKFGSMDEAVKDGTNVVKLPSHQAMESLAVDDPKVKRELLGNDFDEEFEVDEDGEDPYGWVAKLEVNPKNPKVPIPNAHNAEVILTNGPLQGVFAYDAFGNTEVIRGELPWRERARPKSEYEPWLGSDDKRLLHYFGKAYDFKAAELIRNAFTEVVHQNAFHPVKEYLEAQEWDGIPRLDTLFIDYLGADDSNYVRVVTRKMFVAAVKRLYEPGCKFDNMLVLVGPQGAHKSSLLAKMGRKWFSDSLKTFDNKEAAEHLQGSWILEIGELAAMKKAAVEEIKQFLSKESDKYRVAYDRQVSEFPRKCVFFGTTNNHDFLKDATGNRRFWPVTVDPEKRKLFHFTDLSEDEVGQIWAEALGLYNGGETLTLDREAAEEAVKVQGEHMEDDPREGLVLEYLNAPLPEGWETLDIWDRRQYLQEPTGPIERVRVCAAEIWAECLGNDPAKFSVWEARQLYDILRRAPGWVERVPSRLKFKHYGKQTAFEKRGQ